ncbi:NAD(P)H-quinone oxidoreductase subunit L, chloroplastic isoform X1 [Primulina tabacum]|uniref:NAD(P)H-quinone oxidoreductase subunit L, chloroplastic isoform X1 n=1 Tax=Primulina tabacum TaxID=48773 RepID=UPI003F5A6423
MNSLSSHIPKALPSLFYPCNPKFRSSSISCKQTQSHLYPNSANQGRTSFILKMIKDSVAEIPALAIQVGALLGTVGLCFVAGPAFAVTGVNEEEDWASVLIQSGIAAFLYFIVAPPIIMNWLRIRWYRRGLLEMYLQFMFVFIFYAGILLWAPFLNFRKFPRDPNMKYPWSTPENSSEIKGGFLKYPWAKPEDYD